MSLKVTNTAELRCQFDKFLTDSAYIEVVTDKLKCENHKLREWMIVAHIPLVLSDTA